MASQPDSPLIGNRYWLHNQLGSGGMGVVYRATDQLTGQKVALKRVISAAEHVPFQSDSDTIDDRVALAHEFRSLASLRHPHIITVLDYGFDRDHLPYFTMELLDNPESIVKAARNQPLDAQIGLLIQVLQALAYLHRRGIIHRDLKPSNVPVSDQKVRLLDFGLAVIREREGGVASIPMGTLAYIAPEVLAGEKVTESVDLYAVGVIAYEIWTGVYPFRTERITELFDDIINQPPDLSRLDINPALMEVVGRLLAKSPKQRYSDANQVIAALNATLDQPVVIETLATRDSFIQAAEMVGREAELARLSTVLDRALDGQGSAWLIGGESGVGKSRLLGELRTMAMVHGALVLSGRCISEGSKPYQVWRDPLRWLSLITPLSDDEAAILKTLVPDIETLQQRTIPDAPDAVPQAVQANLLSAIEAVIVRQSQPVVIILEDLHWVGDESLILLNRMISLASGLPLLIVGSFRSDEYPTLPEKLPDMSSLRLNRLDDAAIAAWSESMLGSAGRQGHIIDFLQRETEGNAFFMVEVVRALAEEAGQLDKIADIDLPDHFAARGIHRIIQYRLSRVPAADYPLLQLAALAGRQIDPNVLRLVQPDLESWLTICADAAVLSAEAGRWEFSHDKLRESVVADLPDDERKMLHRRIAALIQRAYPDPADEVQHEPALAHHFYQGEQWEQAATYLIQAGEAAARLYAHSEARQHYEQALTALSHLSDSADNRRRLVETHLWAAYVSFSHDPSGTLAQMLEAETLAKGLVASGEGEDSRLLARVHYWLGRAYSIRNESPEAIRQFERVLSLGDNFDDVALFAITRASIGWVKSRQGRYTEAMALLLQAIGPIEEAEDWANWVGTSGHLALGTAMCGDYAAGLARGQDMLMRTTERRNLRGMAVGHFFIAMIHLAGGEFALMRDESQFAAQVAEQSGDLAYLCGGLGCCAWAASRLGDHESARKHLATLAAFSAKLGGNYSFVDIFSAAEAEIALNAGNPTEALALADRALAVAAQCDGLFAAGIAFRVRAQALFRLDASQEESVDSALLSSLEMFHRGGAEPEVARTLLAWATLDDQQHCIDAAREHLQRAISIFKDSNLQRELKRAEAHLSTLQ